MRGGEGVRVPKSKVEESPESFSPNPCRLHKTQDEDLEGEKRSVCAFVTFENDEGKDGLIKLWSKLRFNGKRKKAKACCRIECCCPTPFEEHPPATFDTPEYMFRGKHKLQVRRAKEPEGINFENLEKSAVQTILGRSISALICFVVLILSLSLIFAVKTHSKALKPTAVCDNEIDYTYEMSLETSHNHECYCMTKGMEDFEHCSEVFYSLLYSYGASFITAVINVVLASTIRKTAGWALWKSRSR